MVGMPKGRSFPLALGIKTLRRGRGLYPRRFNRSTASRRLSGESHSSRSTPAVRAPWFCVTRRTACNLADNVRVNIRCKAFTLRHLPSRVAFAIRICIPLTFRSTRRQSTAYQLSGAWESADPVFRLDTFMLLSYLEKSPSRRRISPSGVDTPRWGTTNTSVRAHAPVPNQDTEGSQPSCDGRPDGSLPAFAWSNVSTPIRTITARRSLFPSSHTRTINSVPYGPPASQTALATIRAYHVPGMSHDWLRFCLFPGGLMTTQSDLSTDCPTAHRLVNATQQLRHRIINEVYQQFTYINLTNQPCSSTPSLLGVSG